MTAPAQRLRGDTYGRSRRPEARFAVRTWRFVALVTGCALGACLTLPSLAGRLTSWPGLLALTLISALSNLPDRASSVRSVQISMVGTLMLAAIPLGLGLGIPALAIGHAVVQIGRLEAVRVIFNAAMSVVIGIAGLAIYRILDGPMAGEGGAVGALTVLHVAGVLAVANLVQLFINAAMMAVIIWSSRGIAIGGQFRTIILRGGLTYLATGSMSMPIYVLWVAAEGGPASVVLLLPILYAARWALATVRAEDLTQVRVIDTLNAAMDARSPGSALHATQVARVAEWLAEEVDLGPARSIDLALTGALLRVDSLAAPPQSAGAARAPRPSRALVGLEFLSEVLPVLEHDPTDRSVVEAGRLVAVADAYVEARRGLPEGELLEAYEAILHRPDLDASALLALRKVLDRLDPLPAPTDRGSR